MSTELVEAQKAVAEFDRVATGLAALKALFAGVVYDVRTTKGMDDAKAARLALRKPRYEIEAIRKTAKAPIVALGKKLDSEAARITAEIMTIEGPVDEQIKNEEQRKENERLAKIEAERKRVEDIQAHINYIRGLPLKGSGKSSAHAQTILAEAQAVEIDEEFAEFADEAKLALASAIAALTGIVAERQVIEVEQAKIIADLAELARFREEQSERERVAEEARKAERAEQERAAAAERARIAEENRQAKMARDAETAHHNEQLRLQREESDRQARERQAVIDVENARIEAANRAEADRVAAERAELEREKEADRQARVAEEARLAEQARIASLRRPEDDEIIQALCERFKAPRAKVITWVLAIDFSKFESAAA